MSRLVRPLSDVERVHVDMWRNPDQGNRVTAGAIPIGDYDIEQAPERGSFESFGDGVEPYDFWGDAPKPKSKGGRPKGSKSKSARRKNG